MNDTTGMLSEESVELFMDYGQFCIDGGLGDADEELELLEQALAAQPFASNGRAVVVLSPHQNNFRMPVSVQVWDRRPPDDRDEWEQVCETRLRVDDGGGLTLSSPTDGYAGCDVPAGAYLIEISGRGFLTYGWPGSTEPGDSWRIRLWPDDGSEPRPARQWEMPGYGVPDNDPMPEPAAATEPDAAESAADDEEWVMILDGAGAQRITVAELRERAAADERRRWGGEPIPRLEPYAGAEDIARFDRRFAEALAVADEAQLRRVAIRAATLACEKAGIAEKDWIAAGLDAVRSGAPLPALFADPEAAFDRLHAEEFGSDGEDRALIAVLESREPAGNPFYDGRPVHRPSFALPTIGHAAAADPLEAAVRSIYEAGLVYGPEAAQFFAVVRSEVGLPATRV